MKGAAPLSRRRFLIGLVLAAVAALGAAFGLSRLGTPLSNEESRGLVVRLTDVPGYVYIDQAFDYAIEYENQNRESLRDVVVGAALPPLTSFREASDGGAIEAGQLVWRIGLLPAGRPGRVRVTLHLQDYGVDRGELLLSASIQAGARAAAAQAQAATGRPPPTQPPLTATPPPMPQPPTQQPSRLAVLGRADDALSLQQVDEAGGARTWPSMG